MYILMHRKRPVAEISIDTETAVISKVGEVFAPEHIPVGISFKDARPNRGDLNDWWQGRSIPPSRQNIRTVIKKLGVTSTHKLIIKCFGLSLYDQYWVNPADSPIEWESVNFFENAFSEDVGDVMFGADVNGRKINLLSPDNTSDGWLKKKWKIIEGKRCLMKGGSDPFQQQPVNEVMAVVVMKRLRIPYVPYSIIWEDGLPYSVCENFITSETELVNGFYICNIKRIKSVGEQYNHYLECCSALGIPKAQIHLDKMLTVDFLIANTDRHFNNFGAVRNAETLEWIMPAPLYDNGSSLWYNQSIADIRSGNNKSQPFLDTHEEQIKLVKDFSWVDFTDLIGLDEEFNELLSASPFIDSARRDALCEALKERVEILSRLMRNKFRST